MKPEVEPVLLIVSFLIVGGVVVYIASRMWGVKNWKGVVSVALSVIAIAVVGCILLLLFISLFSPSFD